MVKNEVVAEYKPKVYKFVISPYYANYSLFAKVANDDTSDWEMLANGASGREVIKSMVQQEVDKIFDEYDYGVDNGLSDNEG